MKRLLCIVGSMNAGGAETFLMKLYRALDKSKYQMDFCVSKPEKGFYDDEIESMGGKILHTTAKSKNPFASVSCIYKIVKEGQYKHVMRISQHSLSATELAVARLAGAKILVFRSSNSKTMKDGIEALLHGMFMFLPRTIPNVKIAPSLPAAKFMFGKRAVQRNEVLYLNNGIPLDLFAYNEEARQRVRNELDLGDAFVVGHIGRFTKQKNHRRIIEIFDKIRSIRQDARLVLVGQGELEAYIKEYVEQLGMSDRVCFAGVRRDVPDVLSAMDVFLFPSLYEGMPNTIIEAQANGLPCVMSDTITEEAVIADNVTVVSLSAGNAAWTEKILSGKREKPFVNAEKLRRAGYDINNVVEVFTKNVFGI